VGNEGGVAPNLIFPAGDGLIVFHGLPLIMGEQE
jgi:hypothetical protein